MAFIAARLGLAPLIVSALGCTAGSPRAAEPKVVGGRLSAARHHFAGVMTAGADDALCGGVFVEKDVVLTTAHCVASQGRRLFVSEGLTVNSDHMTAPLAPVLAVVAHPDFDPETLNADVALLLLGPVDDPRFRPEPLPVNRRPELPEESAGALTVVGFGNASSFGNLYLDDLREVDVPLVPLDLCRQGIGERYQNVRDTEICAGDFARGGVDSCEGDSGSPLLQKLADGSVTVVGLVSWGEGCALPGRPGVYVRLSSYARWIWDNVRRLDLAVPSFGAPEARYVAKARCYDDYATVTDAESEAGTLKLIDRYAMTGTLTAGLGEAGPAASPTCAATGFGRTLAAEVQRVARGTAEERLELKISQHGRLGWRAPVRLDRMVIAECQALGIFLSSTVSQGYGQLRIDGKIFGVKSRSEAEASTEWPKRRACALPGLELEARWSDEKAEIVVRSDALGVFVLEAEPAMGEDARRMDLVLALDEAGAGTATLTNGSAVPLQTWELACNFPLTLSYDGVTASPYRDEEGFFHALVDGTPSARIEAGTAAQVDARATAALPEEPECRLNGLGIRTLVTGR